MKKFFGIICAVLTAVPAGLAWWLFPENTAGDQESANALSLRKKAYNTAQQGDLDEAAKNFASYLGARPNDAQANYDCAVLLAQLGKHEEAAALLEKLHRMSPAREAAYFKLGVEYVILKRDADAAKVFSELQSSGNRDVALAAAEAASRLAADQDRAEHYSAEAEVYRLAREFKHDEVVKAVDAMEKRWPVSYEMEMQRLYALENLQQYAASFERATALSAKFPQATDLMLLRADLLWQLSRKDEAVALWQQVEKDFPGTSAAIVASNRLDQVRKMQEEAASSKSATVPALEIPAKPSDEEIIYNLAGKQQFREVVAAIDQLEAKRGSLTWDMQMQRLYSLQALTQKEHDRAIALAEKMSKDNPKSVELAMLRADLLVNAKRWEDASAVLKDVKDNNPNTPAEKEALRRLEAIPAMCNLDKNNWGEFYSSGDYHNRFNDIIGSGFIRDGTYVPGARWLQPYAGMRYGVDTKSGTSGGQTTVVQDNFVSLVGGVRAQIFPKEYLFAYAEAGFNKDLLERRHNGDWAFDYSVGVYGFKAYGPGVVFKDVSQTNAPASDDKMKCPFRDPFWRGDWFVDAGADFSYYHRYDSWLGFGQAHEGARLVQFGSSTAFDAYLVENVAWDVKGNYFDNLFEIGPGVRLIYEPRKRWQIVLRTEWVEGLYFGRDDQNTRGSAAGSYGDYRIGLSVGATW